LREVLSRIADHPLPLSSWLFLSEIRREVITPQFIAEISRATLSLGSSLTPLLLIV